MAKHSISKAIFFGLSIFSFLWTSQAHKLAPALYVFGDSNVDPGNNNLLDTHAKSNYAPYGVDFPNGLITGRPTNGYNVADFFGKFEDHSRVFPRTEISKKKVGAGGNNRYI